MRILHIITGLENGGAESTLFRLVNADKKNVHIVISLTNEGVYGERLCKAGIRVDTLKMRRGQINPFFIFKLSSLIKSMRPDAIQTWMYHADLIGGIAARIAGIKAIAWGVRNSTLNPSTTSLSSRLVMKVCARLSKIIPAKIISCSSKAKQTHIDLGYSSKNFSVIPNGYDLTKLSPNRDSRLACRNKWGFDSNEIVIGIVARWDPQKDHASLVKALNKIADPNIKCVLVGTNMDSNNTPLVDMVNASKISKSIYLMGPTVEVPLVMNGLDLHILPSAYGEAFPNVVAEAMACGVPCVSTDVGDAGFIVGETGWIVPPSDPDALAVAIQDALTQMIEKETWQKRKMQCVQRVTDNFSIEKMVDAFNLAWQELLEKGN